MLLRVLIAAEAGEISARVETSLDTIGAIPQRAESPRALWRFLSSEPFDLVVFDTLGLRGVEAIPVLSETRGLPDAPDVVVLHSNESAECRAGLLVAGACATLSRTLPGDLFDQALLSIAARCLQARRKQVTSSGLHWDHGILQVGAPEANLTLTTFLVPPRRTIR